MTVDADQLHPPPGDGPVVTADERPNVAGLDNVMNVLQASPLVKKRPARKNELLHAVFRNDSLARTKGEPIAMWLVRYNEQVGKLNRVVSRHCHFSPGCCWLAVPTGCDFC